MNFLATRSSTVRIVCLILLLCAGARPRLDAAPVNDNWAEATELVTGTNGLQIVILIGTTFGATVETGEENCPELAPFIERGTIWWKWTPTVSGSAQFAIWSTTNAGLAAGSLMGDSVSNLTMIDGPWSDPFANPNGDGLEDVPGGITWLTAEAGHTYFFVTMNVPGHLRPAGTVEGMFMFWAPEPPPVRPENDSFTNRIALSGTNVAALGNNDGATAEPGEPLGSGGGLRWATLWYSWTAPTNGVVYLSATPTNRSFNPLVFAFSGTALDSLTALPPTLDGGYLVAPGDTIQIQVSSLDNIATGPFWLDVHLVARAPASVNDSFASRPDITMPRYHFSGSIYGATNEPGEPLPNPGRRQTLWWRLAPEKDGFINISVGGPFAVSFALYEGGQFAAMTPLAAINGNRYRVMAGHEYSLQLSSALVASGSVWLDTLFRSTANDMFADSEQLEGTNLIYYGNYSYATFEPGEPTSPATNTAWVSWVAPFDGVMRGPLGPNMKIYTGSALVNLQEVPVHYFYSDPRFLVNAGTVYHLRCSGAGGDYTLNLEGIPYRPMLNDHFSDAGVVQGSVFNIGDQPVLGATMEVGEPAHLGAAEQKSVWWRWQAPRSGFLRLQPWSMFIPHVLIAVYQGNSVDALGLVAKGTNLVDFAAVGGQTYEIAAVVPAAAQGVFNLSAQQRGLSGDHFLLPGNILCDPSWELFGVVTCWYHSGGIGGYFHEPGGLDGTSWPVLPTGTRVWQDVPTIPGHEYAIQFAHAFGDGCCGIAGVRVYLDDRVLGTAYNPEDEGQWRWEVFTVVASNTVSRVAFENLHRNLAMDAFSMVDLTAPPAIVTQPSSLSTFGGGSAAFVVVVNGSDPLAYQWHHNGAPLPGQTGRILTLNDVSPTDAGSYQVTITNGFGAVTSLVARLTVDAPTNVTILVQPYGDLVPEGGFFHLSVVAAGTPPLTYQWFRNGAALPDGTNRNITLTNVLGADAGVYDVLVQNHGGSVRSLPAMLTVTNSGTGGGLIDFRNHQINYGFGVTNHAPIFDIDGSTPLNGSAFVAQLYAGPALNLLRPVGQPSPFRIGFDAGFFVSKVIALPNVPPSGTAWVQVRVWEQARGGSYEEARALGGRFGRSQVMTVLAGGGGGYPQRMTELTSFNLQQGLPTFNVGFIEFIGRMGDGAILWSVRGQPGFRYSVEKSAQTGSPSWHPFTILSNVTGSVTFTDVPGAEATAAFYRARILD